MTLRDLLPTEAEEAAALDAASPTAAHWMAADYARLARGEFPARFCLVAEEPPGQMGGLLLAVLAPPEAEILNLVVAPALLRKGVATALAEEAMRRMAEAGVQRVWLEVRASNVAAQAFYRRLGFRDAGRRPRYYKDPSEDALVLEASVPGHEKKC